MYKPAIIAEAIELALNALEENSDAHWVVGFSGGKDSTALLKILYSAAAKARKLPKTIDVIYCDTGVENPLLDQYVKTLFGRLDVEFADSALPFRTHILKAPVADRFFVKIIGRGYPPPTNSFRWCTKNLRILPVARFIEEAAKKDAVVCLGMRRGESQQRDRTLLENGDDYWQIQKEAKRPYRLFLPILDFDIPDVWDAIFEISEPYSIDAAALEKLYRGATGGECPLIKAINAPPCGSGRFGCWTCTVVRKDKSAISLIEAGHKELIPYLDFRNWIADIRNDSSRRWPYRRNGSMRPGPFTLEARKEILEKLTTLEHKTKTLILTQEERAAIAALWELDQNAQRNAS